MASVEYVPYAEVVASIKSDIAWLVGAVGRYSRLASMGAPAKILTNERRCWDEKMQSVKRVLSEGRVSLASKGTEQWAKGQEEYSRVTALYAAH